MLLEEKVLEASSTRSLKHAGASLFLRQAILSEQSGQGMMEITCGAPDVPQIQLRTGSLHRTADLVDEYCVHTKI